LIKVSYHCLWFGTLSIHFTEIGDFKGRRNLCDVRQRRQRWHWGGEVQDEADSDGRGDGRRRADRDGDHSDLPGHKRNRRRSHLDRWTSRWNWIWVGISS